MRFATLLMGIGMLAAGCVSEMPSGYATSSYGGNQQVMTSGGAQSVAPSGQYLYLPATNVSPQAVQSATIQTSDGRQYSLSSGDIRSAAAGRLALTLPGGVTDGTATINVNGQVLSIPFHIVASMTTAPVMGSSPPVVATDPNCGSISGTWVGNIWSTADARAVAYLQVLSDCRTVQGTISASAPGSGSVDATIEGQWDPASGVLIARDTQLFNVRPVNGTNFCPTTRYELRLGPDGSLTGSNDTQGTSCGQMSPVYLRRGQ